MVNDVHLYDSTICRLCAADNGNEHLFISEVGESDLCSLVNRYLPLKIHDDGKLPRTICPGCNIQLEATAQFFELLVAGQRKIRELWKNQLEQQRKADRLRNKKENTVFRVEGIEVDSTAQYNETEQYEQQMIIKIMPDGSLYTAEHEMSLQMEGLTKPRRKRGRPPKVYAEATKENSAETVSQGEEDKQEEEEEEIDGDGRRRRKRKVPKRFLEAVQGKELERIFKEEGVIDEEDNDFQMFNDSEALLNTSSQDGQEEVIGHLETEEGTDLGEVVIVNRGRIRSKSKLRRRKNKFTCQLCGKGFLQRSRYIVHKSFHKGIKHECTQCKKLFDTKENLVLHQQTTQHNSNSAEKNVEAQESRETLSPQPGTSTMKLQDEMARDSKSTIYKCEKCDKQFELKREYELHIKVHEQPEFICNICNKTFTNQSDLKMHVTTHGKTKSDKDYACDICGKVLNHPSSVLYHKEAEHNNGRRFVCNKCNKSFKHKQLLQRHQLVHSDNRPHVCKSCNASFKTKANLINHQSTHTGQKKYLCEICKQQFAHKTSLTLHYRWHSGQKPYTCTVCQKSFSQNGNLQEHMRIHTGEKPYSCDYCGRKFTTSSQFKLHVKRHTGERPWKCEFCAKSFLHKDTWKCHVRRHKGERPFQCNQCNRGFTEQWALKKHLRLHTGEKPYSCDVCGKAFADCSNLTKHKKVHRENKMLTVNRSEGSPIGEVWQILPNSQETDERTFNDQIITTDEASNDEIQQIIYVSYQDPQDPNQSRTLHLVDANVIKNKDMVTTNTNSLSRLNVENEISADKVMNNAASNNEEQSEFELSDSDLQLQITDEHGNPIPLSIQEARQLLSQGHFISQLNDSQIIRVHPGMFAQQLQALNIHVDEDTVEESGIMVRPSTTKNIETMSAIQADAEAIVQALEDENTDATAVATINQLGSIEQAGLMDGEQAIEFMTQDGQKVRVLTSCPIDPMQLASEYLTIV
ncbi:zinc finger and SCAN domain-containing protein 2 isoform X2 [Solenopsis invicta]|uniref:zinc finger and SCAN domain-containing protein 2 isoform X2 n=1 Tax=Solenopsis invicta TaxID=13686 RepID=UPI0005958E1D|nr:zinc finger and SCAN domain-containing protein 2 isoform X2 [Solenopsis invicta]